MPADSSPITEYLLQNPVTKDLYRKATEAPFLRLGGQGKLPKDTLSRWLAQDRLYAQAYIRFIGGLISQVRLPQGSDRATTDSLEWRILSLMYDALGALKTELQFYDKTAAKYGLDLAARADGDGEFGPNEITRACIEEFDSYGADSPVKKTLLQGLVFLWTLEKVYLDAWTYAKGQDGGGSTGDGDLDGGALRKAFIPNWTSTQFSAFVTDLQECLDEYAVVYDGDNTRETAFEVWKVCLVLEEGFWPPV